MAAVTDLRPANAIEARLAVEIVAADAYAMDCFGLAGQFRNDLAATLRCRAQGTAMMRQVKSTRLMLEREQAMRPKAPAAPVAAPEPAPPPDPVAEAENYAVLHTDEAARIRANLRQDLPVANGLDPGITLPDPAIIEALGTGTTPMLCELDAIARELAEVG